jgi:16S rRNA (cytidine1402-2'-O)-methyltransferase
MGFQSLDRVAAGPALSTSPTGTLHLIPVPIGESGAGEPVAELSTRLITLAARLDYVIAENARSARAFLKRLPLIRPIQEIEIRELNEHTSADEIPNLIAPLLAGRDAGLVSEAGCPAVADPGSQLVAAAHRAGITVMPHIGPSALILTLMASGLEGQRFAFAGYLPAQPQERSTALQRLEDRSARGSETQLWIETPYRSQAMIATALQILHPTTLFAVACDLASPQQWISSKTIALWQKTPPDLNNRLTVFALLADQSISATWVGQAGHQIRLPSQQTRQNVSRGAPPHSPAGKNRRRSPP